MRTVADVVSDALITRPAATTVGEARTLFRTYRMGCLPIVDDSQRPVGIITATDLVAPRDDEIYVSSIMNTDVITADLDAPLKVVAGLMMVNYVHHIIVVDDDGRALGVLSAFDLLGEVANGHAEAPTA